MTKIKICGLTDVREAAYLREAAVDYAGMVLFFPKSKRNIPVAQAEQIMQALGDSVQKVAVVVSPSLEQVRAIEAAGFDILQIHGAVEDSLLQQIRIPFWRAFNGDNMQEIERFRSMNGCIGYVFDAPQPGSGQVFDWSQIPERGMSQKLSVLAGGLHAQNVSEAVRQAAPDVVDVSSGVEYTDRSGKDPERIRAFVDAVRRVSLGTLSE